MTDRSFRLAVTVCLALMVLLLLAMALMMHNRILVPGDGAAGTGSSSVQQ